MGYWLKKFIDGTEVRGTDHQVAMRAASWSRSRFDGMIEAEIEYDGLCLQIVGLGEFWQSDTYESAYPGPSTSMTQRRIARRIVPTDTHFRLSRGNALFRIEFNSQQLNEGAAFQAIKKEWHNQWLVLEMNLKTKQLRYYIRSERI